MLHAFLPLVLAYGAFISILDMKTGIIRNRYILLLLFFGLLYRAMSGAFINPLPILYTLVYGFFVLMLLWWVGFWPGGDAKYFGVMLLFFPHAYYSTQLVMSFLFYTFVPVFVFMAINVVRRSSVSKIRDAIEYSVKLYRIIYIIFIVLGFMWFFIRGLSLFGINADYFFLIVVLFFAFELMSLFRSHIIEFFFVALIIIRAAINPWGLLSLSTLQELLLLLGGFLFLRFFLLHLSYYSSTNKVGIRQLKPGMMPAQGVSKTSEGYALVSFLNSSLIEYLQQKRMRFIHSLDELSGKDVERINDLRTKGKISFSGIRIYQTQPFAVFILIGYAMTLVFGVSLF